MYIHFFIYVSCSIRLLDFMWTRHNITAITLTDLSISQTSNACVIKVSAAYCSSFPDLKMTNSGFFV